MSAASSTVSTSASPTAPTTTRDSDEARAVRAARRRAFGEPGDGNPTERWNAPANREHLGGSPLFAGPGGAGSWEQLRGWTEARRAGNLTGL